MTLTRIQVMEEAEALVLFWDNINAIAPSNSHLEPNFLVSTCARTELSEDYNANQF